MAEDLVTDDPRSYNIGAIRDLLLAAFTAEGLRRFCQDRPEFRPIVDRFGPKHGKDDMVAEVVDYCETHRLFSELLVAVKAANPRQYARFESQLFAPAKRPLPKPPWPEWQSRFRDFFRARRGLFVLAALMLLAAVLALIGFVIWNRIENQKDPVYWMGRFRQTRIPDLQVERLARLLDTTGYEEEARSLFFDELTHDEQVAMFGVSDPAGSQQELFVVIQVLYTRLAYSPQNQEILGAMAHALSQIEDFESTTIRYFALEVNHWKDGQDAYAQGDLKAAQESLDNALALNSKNPAAFHDRALVLAARGKQDEALSDLEQVLKLDRTYYEETVRAVIDGDPELFTYLGLHRFQYPRLATHFPTLTPTPTPTFTPSPTPTATSTPAPTDTSTSTSPVPTSITDTVHIVQTYVDAENNLHVVIEGLCQPYRLYVRRLGQTFGDPPHHEYYRIYESGSCAKDLLVVVDVDPDTIYCAEIRSEDGLTSYDVTSYRTGKENKPFVGETYQDGDCPFDESCSDTELIDPPVFASTIQITMTQECKAGYGYSLYEVEAYGPDNPEKNLIPGGTITATSEHPEFPANNAIDSTVPTRWASQEGEAQATLTIHLPEPQFVSRVVLVWAGSCVPEYEVRASPPYPACNAFFVKYGNALRIPVPADYDGDGLIDLSVKGSNGHWRIDFSGNGFGGIDKEVSGAGGADCVPVPADYDGDGKAELSIKDSDGIWCIAYPNAKP